MDCEIEVWNFRRGRQGEGGQISGRIVSGKDGDKDLAGWEVHIAATGQQVSMLATHPCMKDVIDPAKQVPEAAVYNGAGTTRISLYHAVAGRTVSGHLPYGRLPDGLSGTLELRTLAPGEESLSPVFLDANGRKLEGLVPGVTRPLPDKTSIDWQQVSSRIGTAPQFQGAIKGLPLLRISGADRNRRPEGVSIDALCLTTASPESRIAFSDTPRPVMPVKAAPNPEPVVVAPPPARTADPTATHAAGPSLKAPDPQPAPVTPAVATDLPEARAATDGKGPLEYDIKVTGFARSAQGPGIISGKVVSGEHAGRRVDMYAPDAVIASLVAPIAGVFHSDKVTHDTYLIGRDGKPVDPSKILPDRSETGYPRGEVPEGYRAGMTARRLKPGEVSYRTVLRSQDGTALTGSQMNGPATVPQGAIFDWKKVDTLRVSKLAFAEAIASLPVLHCSGVLPARHQPWMETPSNSGPRSDTLCLTGLSPDAKIWFSETARPAAPVAATVSDASPKEPDATTSGRRPADSLTGGRVGGTPSSPSAAPWGADVFIGGAPPTSPAPPAPAVATPRPQAGGKAGDGMDMLVTHFEQDAHGFGIIEGIRIGAVPTKVRIYASGAQIDELARHPAMKGGFKPEPALEAHIVRRLEGGLVELDPRSLSQNPDHKPEGIVPPGYMGSTRPRHLKPAEKVQVPKLFGPDGRDLAPAMRNGPIDLPPGTKYAWQGVDSRNLAEFYAGVEKLPILRVSGARPATKPVDYFNRDVPHYTIEEGGIKFVNAPASAAPAAARPAQPATRQYRLDPFIGMDAGSSGWRSARRSRERNEKYWKVAGLTFQEPAAPATPVQPEAGQPLRSSAAEARRRHADRWAWAGVTEPTPQTEVQPADEKVRAATLARDQELQRVRAREERWIRLLEVQKSGAASHRFTNAPGRGGPSR